MSGKKIGELPQGAADFITHQERISIIIHRKGARGSIDCGHARGTVRRLQETCAAAPFAYRRFSGVLPKTIANFWAKFLRRRDSSIGRQSATQQHGQIGRYVLTERAGR
jgi:hypothetical protein